jgi:chromosome segregation ATPase
MERERKLADLLEKTKQESKRNTSRFELLLEEQGQTAGGMVREAEKRSAQDAETMRALHDQLEDARRAAERHEQTVQQTKTQLRNTERRAEEEEASVARLQLQLQEAEVQVQQGRDSAKELEDRLHEALVRTAEVENTSQVLHTSVVEGEGRAKSLAEELAVAKQELENLEIAFQAQCGELSRASSAISDMQQAASVHDEDMTRYTQQCDQRVAEVEDLLRQQDVEIGSMKDASHAGILQYDELAKKMKEEKVLAESALERLKMQGEKALEESRSECETLSKNLVASHTKSEALVVELTMATSQQEVFAQELEMSKSKCASLSVDLVALKAHAEDLSEKLEVSETEYKAVSLQVVASGAAADLSKSKIEGLFKDLAMAKSENVELRAKSEALSLESREHSEALKNKLEASEMECQTVTCRMVATEAAADLAKAKFESLLNDLELAKSEYNAVGQELMGSQTQCGVLSHQLAVSKTECQNLSRQLLATEAAADLQLKQQQFSEIDTRQDTIVSLQADVAQLKRGETLSGRMLAEKDEEVSKLKAGRGSILESIELMGSVLEEKDRELQSVKDALHLEKGASAELSSKIEGLRALLTGQSEENAARLQNVEATQEELRMELREAYASADARCKLIEEASTVATEQEIGRLQTKIATLNESHQEEEKRRYREREEATVAMEAENLRLGSMVEALQASVTALEFEVSQAREQMDESVALLGVKDQEIEFLKQAQTSLKEEYQSGVGIPTARTKMHDTTVTELHTTISSLEEKVKFATLENGDLALAKQFAEKRLAEMELQVAELQAIEAELEKAGELSVNGKKFVQEENTTLEKTQKGEQALRSQSALWGLKEGHDSKGEKDPKGVTGKEEGTDPQGDIGTNVTSTSCVESLAGGKLPSSNSGLASLLEKMKLQRGESYAESGTLPTGVGCPEEPSTEKSSMGRQSRIILEQELSPSTMNGDQVSPVNPHRLDSAASVRIVELEEEVAQKNSEISRLKAEYATYVPPY